MNNQSIPGAYAFVGMGALAARATYNPLTSIIIIFGMTGDYMIILLLMLACIFSMMIATRLNPESIFTRFDTRDVEQIPVVDKDNNRKVIGMLSRCDLINAYNKAVLKKGISTNISDL